MTEQTAGSMVLASVVLDLMPGIHSAIAAGHGDGALLRELARLGVGYIQGVAQPFLTLENGRRFDLAISLEVAQLLPSERADAFIDDLTRLSNMVLFSAAIPGQNEKLHSNERWQDEWAASFQARGYYAIDAVRPRIWHRDDVDAAVRQNTILYSNLAGLERYPGLLTDRVSLLSSLRVVHPQIWAAVRANSTPARKPVAQAIPAYIRRASERWLGVQ